MKKIILFIGLVVALQLGAYAQEAGSVFNKGETGTASATVIVPPGSGLAKVTDLAAQIDAANTSATVDVRVGKTAWTCSSASTASGTTVWFANAGTVVAVQSYVIVLDGSGNYLLRKVSAATTTSVTVYSAITGALTTSSKIWLLDTAVRRPMNHASSQTAAWGGGFVEMWLPSTVPSALTLDGNTTACSLSVSGYRLK